MARTRRGGSAAWAIAVFLIAAGLIGAFAAYRYGLFEEAPPMRPAPPPEAVRPPSVPSIPARPRIRVAIIIDDMGRDRRRIEEILGMRAPITVAVLPYLPHSKDVARAAHAGGLEVMLHLPMEPRGMENGEHDPGRGVLLTAMDARAVREGVEDGLADVPFAAGVNNHMGSLFTENEPLMREVAAVLKKRGLYFIDSRTTAASVAGRVASEMGVRSASRNVFLDNERDVRYISGQIDELVSIARRNGGAIAIGHPYPETIAALEKAVPALKQKGVEVVKASELLR